MLGLLKNLKQKDPKIFKLAIVLIVALLALGAGILYTVITKDSGQTAQDKFNSVQERADKAYDQQGYEKAVGIWQEYLDENPPQEFKYQAHIQLAGSLMNLQKFQEARDNFRLAEKEKEGEQYEIVLGIAQSSEAMGDKQTAVEYYTKVVEILKRNERPYSQLDLQVYEAKLNQLEGKPNEVLE